MPIFQAYLLTFVFFLLSSTTPVVHADSELVDLTAQWLEANNTQDERIRNDLIDQIVAPTFASSGMTGSVDGNREGLKAYLKGAHLAFDNYHLAVVQQVIKDNKIWMAIEATGISRQDRSKNISVGTVVILKIAYGKIVREWHLTDMAALEAQLSGDGPA